MTKSDLIKHLAKAHDITQVRAQAILEDLILQIQTALVAGDRVTLAGLGGFHTAVAAERSGTAIGGQPYHTPARTVVKFHPAAQLTAALPVPASA